VSQVLLQIVTGIGLIFAIGGGIAVAAILLATVWAFALDFTGRVFDAHRLFVPWILKTRAGKLPWIVAPAGSLEAEVARLREELELAESRADELIAENTADRDEAERDRLRVIHRSLGDGWHTLRNGGLMRLADGEVIAIDDCGTPGARDDTKADAVAFAGRPLCFGLFNSDGEAVVGMGASQGASS